jgi:hypothetical protein
VPSAASAWFDWSVAAAVVGLPSATPEALPRKTKAAPSSISPPS